MRIIIAVFAVLAALLWLKSRFLDLMIKGIESPYGYEETVEKISKNIAGKKGWHIFRVVNQGEEIVMNGGADTGKITVIQYCHGVFASRMFEDDSRKKISVFSPKAVSVYLKSDGKTYISMMNGEMMKLAASVKMKELIVEVSSEVKEIMSVMRVKTPGKNLI